MKVAWALGLAALITAGLSHAAQGSGSEPGGWYLALGGGAQSFEGWSSGTHGALILGRKLAYRHPDAPRSSVAVEFGLDQSIDPVPRRRSGDGAEVDVTSGNLYLAVNTHVTERIFYRARLGLVLRHLEFQPDDRSRTRGRIGFGLGGGVAVAEWLDLVADAGLQYMGSSALLYTGTLSMRVHF